MTEVGLESQNEYPQITIHTVTNDKVTMSMEHVLRKNISCNDVTHILEWHDRFLICGGDPMLSTQTETRKLLFLKNHEVLAFNKDLIWSLRQDIVYAFDYDGVTIATEKLPDEFVSIFSTTAMSNTLYICCNLGMLYIDILSDEETSACKTTRVRGVFEQICFSNFGDILVYGDGKVYVSLSTTVPNISKQSFLYDSGLIQMFWFDVFIAQVFNSHISAIDNSGKQHHLYRPDADKIFLTASSGNAWMAALTATNEVYILDQELTLRYVVEKPGERIMQRRTLCGYRQAFIIDDNTAYRYVAAPHSKYYDWANEIDDWRRGSSDSLKVCLSLKTDVIKSMLMESITTWLTLEPDVSSAVDLGKICKKSIEVIKSFIDSFNIFLEKNIKHCNREFWSNVFSIVSEVLNNGFPEASKLILEREKNVFAIAECADIFGIEVFGTSDMITWIIVNQREAIYRELMYKFLNSEKYGNLFVEIIAKTCSTFTPSIASSFNNPFYILDTQSIIDNCKKGFADDWLQIFKIFAPMEVNLHIQNIFDNLSDHLVFKNDLNMIVKCLLLAEKPSKLTIASTIKNSMMRYVYESLPKQFHTIEKDNIPLVLKLLDINPMWHHGVTFSGKACIACAINNCGIYIGTLRGVYTLPYVGLRGQLKQLSKVKVMTMAAATGKLAIAGKHLGDNILYVYNTNTDYLLSAWETSTPVLEMVFLENVLFTVQKDSSIIVYNYTTGRIEEVLRCGRRDEDSDDEDEGVQVHPQPHPPPPPPSDETEESMVGVPPPPITRPVLRRPCVIPPPPPFRGRHTLTVVDSTSVIECQNNKIYVWKKRGLTFSVRFFMRPNNWITLSCGKFVDDGITFNLYVYISRLGNIQLSNCDATFRSNRRETIMAATMFGRDYIVLGTNAGTVVLFDVTRMAEISVHKIPGSPCIHDLQSDGCELYVTTSKGLHCILLAPWRQQRVLETLMDTATKSDVWLNQIKKHAFDFSSVVPTVKFLHFVDMCTRGEVRVRDTWRQKAVIQALMKLHRRAESLTEACLQRIVDTSEKRKPPFKCSICQSSTVCGTDDNSLFIIRSCLHRFHKKCIHTLIDAQPSVNDFTMNNWALQTNLQCPMCRNPFQKDDVVFDPISTEQCIYASSCEEDGDE